MNIRAFGRLLLSGFGLPNGEFREPKFLPARFSRTLNQSSSGLRTPISKRARTLIPITALAGLVLALFMNIGVAPLPANANNCQVGSSSSCPATSPQEIFNLYGTTTNGVYWLRVGGVAKEVFVVMDRSTSWGGGSWILLMKGARGTSNFGYSNANFTSNTTVLNESSPANNNTSDAKYAAYNSTPLTQIMAVISNPFSGSISNQGDIANNSFGGHTWVESVTGGATAFTRLTTNTSLNNPSNSIAFSSVPVQKYRQTSSNGSTQVFSFQTGTGIYGHNVNCGTGYKARWGILWNNETENTASCDAYV
ncbi:MAG: hypothetical protein NTU72_08560 [Fimbriimonadales bacterium]|nr:hypothetical protein [Fimbriimonadales bacterium]